MKNMKVHYLIKANTNDTVCFLRTLRDYGKNYKAVCSDCGDFTMINLKFDKKRNYRKFEKVLKTMGLHIIGDTEIKKLNWQCV